MLRYLQTAELAARPKLRRTMFRDRARQFNARLGWDVAVDASGQEHDQYDDLPDVLYVIWERPDGSHGGSLRFLPTTGRTMLSEHFSDLTQEVAIRSPYIWECTRFCLAPGAASFVAPAVMLGGLDIGLNRGLSHAVGVFGASMLRVYVRLGWPPAVLGTRGSGRGATSAGLWAFEPSVRSRLLAKAGISPEAADHWYRRSFGPEQAATAA